jgi:hypothetical protein
MLEIMAALALVLAFLGPALAAFAEGGSGRVDYDAFAADRHRQKS